LAALKAKKRNQKSQIASYQAELKILDNSEKELKELDRRVAMDEVNYKLYLSKFQEAKISESMDRQVIANVSVIEPAVPIMRPVKPKSRLNVMIGGFLGLCTGIGLAFLIEFINPVFHTREDVQQFLGLPVLATLPIEQLGALKEDPRKAGRRTLILVASLLLITLIGCTLWYFKVYKNSQQSADQSLQMKDGFQSYMKDQNENSGTVKLNYVKSNREAESNPEQVLRNEEIVSKNIESDKAIRPNFGPSVIESLFDSGYAQLKSRK
jgi:hypothetical protein